VRLGCTLDSGRWSVHVSAGGVSAVFRRRLVLYGTDGMPVLQQQSRSMGHRARLGLCLRDSHDQWIDEPSLAVPE
jgi:hypothetical protein